MSILKSFYLSIIFEALYLSSRVRTNRKGVVKQKVDRRGQGGELTARKNVRTSFIDDPIYGKKATATPSHYMYSYALLLCNELSLYDYVIKCFKVYYNTAMTYFKGPTDPSESR